MMASASSPKIVPKNRKPFLVYGTAWKKEKTESLVSEAVRAGFRHIDTACQPKHYNEAGVGRGWTAAARELNLDRSDFYIQTKFTAVRGQDPKNIPYDRNASLEDQVKESLQVSLKNLQTTYLDTILLHSPLEKMEDTIRVWRVFEKFVADGKVKQLGISNIYDNAKLKALYSMASIKPSVVQNRFYSETNFDTDLRKFCKEHGIFYQSFWTLSANRNALARDEVKEWAKKKGLTPQTFMYAFLMSLGYIAPLSGSTNKKHMAEDASLVKEMQGGKQIFQDEVELRRFAKILGMPDL